MYTEKFDGQVKVRVRFKSRVEYEKFRKYVLKTDWSYSLDYPLWEELTFNFHKRSDIDLLNTKVISLLQLGFEVYCCSFKMEQQLAEEQFPEDDIPDEELDTELLEQVTNHWKEINEYGKDRN